MGTNTLRFGPKPELRDAWVARGDIDIEEILRVVLKSVGPVDIKIAEANAPMVPLIIKNIMENSFLVTINTWITKLQLNTMRDVKVALEKANLNGFVYGGKTAPKSTSSATPPLCYICAVSFENSSRSAWSLR
jgi:hypothetical protein